jgi:hypothetical protein
LTSEVFHNYRAFDNFLLCPGFCPSYNLGTQAIVISSRIRERNLKDIRIEGVLPPYFGGLVREKLAKHI